MGVPSNLLGLLLFVLLLWPGFAYSAVRARRMPERQTSALRETVSIVASSLTALAVVLGLFALIKLRWPGRTPSVRSLIFEPQSYLPTHYVSVAVWGVGMLAVAVVGSAAVAALVTSTRFARVPFVGRMAAPDRSSMSAWWLAFSERSQDEVEIHVGCTLDDGSYVSGRLYSYSQVANDIADRELLLTSPLSVRPKGHDVPFELTGAGLLAVSARHLVTMTVSYVRRKGTGHEPPAAPAAATASSAGPAAGASSGDASSASPAQAPATPPQEPGRAGTAGP